MEKERAMRYGRMRWLLPLALLCAALPAHGAVPGFPDVVDSSFTEANGDRTLQLAIVVPASAKEAFAAFATAEGWKTWAVPFAVGEPRVGAAASLLRAWVSPGSDRKCSCQERDRRRDRLETI